jgi:hypothetical protein
VRVVSAVYGASTVKQRRTNAELAAVDDAIVSAVSFEAPITLRGVYYRVVSAGAVEKTEDGYRLVGRELLKLRRTGRVSYGDITDGTRWITRPTTWTRLDQMLEDASVSYRRGIWHDQGVDVQVFTEKDAISGVILPVTERYDVPLGIVRGYTSESFAWSCAQSVCSAPGEVYVYQLGDHDPSGVDAWRDFTSKVTRFAAERFRDVEDWLHFERLAVTEDQITQWQLPTRPTKRTDTRSKGFRGESVEVDALRPAVLRGIVQDAIERHIDPEALRLTQIAEQSERDILTSMIGGTP